MNKCSKEDPPMPLWLRRERSGETTAAPNTPSGTWTIGPSLKQELVFRTHYKKLWDFRKENGHCYFPTKEKPTGRWIQNIRARYKNSAQPTKCEKKDMLYRDWVEDLRLIDFKFSTRPEEEKRLKSSEVSLLERKPCTEQEYRRHYGVARGNTLSKERVYHGRAEYSVKLVWKRWKTLLGDPPPDLSRN